MNVHQLINELRDLGVRLKIEDNRLQYSPRQAVTPRIAEALKTHKIELLKLLQPATVGIQDNGRDVQTMWKQALERLQGDPDFTDEMLDALQTADVKLVNR